MPNTDYATFHPGQAVADAAALYTQLVNEKKRPRQKPIHPNQAQRDQAHQLPCDRSPVRVGVLSRHCFGISQQTCAYCGETPEWILATPATMIGQTA